MIPGDPSNHGQEGSATATKGGTEVMSYSAGDYFGELVPCLQTVKFPNFSGTYMRVSINGGTPKSSTLIGFSLINHPAIGVPPFMETPKF